MPRIKEIISKYLNDKKYKGIIIMAMAGILLIAFSSFMPEKKEKSQKPEINFSIETIRNKKEKELEEFLEKIDGVSSLSVMISYKDSGTTAYSFNSVSEEGEEERKKENEMVIRKENGNEYPITERITLPEIKGITVICEGKKGMEAKLSRAVSAAAGADIHSVEVIINERN